MPAINLSKFNDYQKFKDIIILKLATTLYIDKKTYDFQNIFNLILMTGSKGGRMIKITKLNNRTDSSTLSM